MCAVYYVLGLPLGHFEQASVDLDDIAAILFMRQPTCIQGSRSTAMKLKSVAIALEAAPLAAPAHILRTFVHWACHVLSVPAQVLMMPIHSVP
jgi:hypothetical protein